VGEFITEVAEDTEAAEEEGEGGMENEEIIEH
jgi:hypothetical protein